MTIYVVFFESKAFPHVIDNQVRSSEIRLLRTKRLKDQIARHKQIQLFRHVLPQELQADHTFNKEPVKSDCRLLNISFRETAANHHEGNAIIESANISLRRYFNRLKIIKTRVGVIQNVAAVTYHGNIARGHKVALLIKLFFNRSPFLSTRCNPSTHGSAEQIDISSKRRQLSTALNANIRKAPSLKVEDFFVVWRDKNGWTALGMVCQVYKRTVTVA